jgi:hypothetical protein
MRTTLTLEDDLVQQLRRLAGNMGLSFKEIVNRTLRKGLHDGDTSTEKLEPFVIKAKACGFQPGVDLRRLNQLYDQLELEDSLQSLSNDPP